MTFVLLCGGIALLVAGGDALVRGASRLASSLGISPLVVGLTVVAFGTSAPELAVSAKAAASGSPALALGNALGSNVFNVLVILGLAALVRPLTVAAQLVRRDVPLMIGASLLVFALALDGVIGRTEGLGLLVLLVIYVAWSAVESRSEADGVRVVYEGRYRRPPFAAREVVRDVLLIGAGLGLLVVGSDLLVGAATSFARALGVSDLVIGLTIVAAGTSLPEVAASVLATVKGERDIAVGNAIGSNVFNLLCVLGLAAVVAPAGVPVAPAALRFDLPVMLAVSVACLPVFLVGGRISRWEGALFLAYYAAYAWRLVLEARGSASLARFDVVVWGWVTPLVAITLGVLAVTELRRRRRPTPSASSGGMT